MLRFATLFLVALATTSSANAFVVNGPTTAIRPSLHDKSGSSSALQAADLATLTSSLQENPQALAAGAAVFLAAGAAAVAPSLFGQSSSTKAVVEEEPEPEPIDVSIPYDSAAKLAYQEYIEAEEGVEYDEAVYQKFKSIFEAKASAEATVKRYNREMASLKE